MPYTGKRFTKNICRWNKNTLKKESWKGKSDKWNEEGKKGEKREGIHLDRSSILGKNRDDLGKPQRKSYFF